MRAYLFAALMFFSFLFLAHMMQAQTAPPPQPTTPCANGQPWQLHPTAKYKWQCPLKNACAHTCTNNSAAPSGQRCVVDFRRNNFVQGVIGSGTPVLNDPNDPDLNHVYIFGASHTWDLSIQKDKNGYECAYHMRGYPGEFPLGDPRNILPTAPAPTPAPLGVPVVTKLSTELLPYVESIP